MKTKSKISGYILRRSAAALLFPGALVALCAAINLPSNHPKILAPPNNAAYGANRHENRSLSFADRVAYQRAIEEVYWRHRIWPDTNRGPKPSLDAVMSQAQIEKKVTEYLRNSQALEDDWQRPITAGQLQNEMQRIASHTKQSEVLREIFQALGNDPFVIAECLARPVLAERLITQLNVQEEKPTTVAWLNKPLRSWLGKAATQVPVTMAAVSSTNYKLPVIAGPSSSCTDDTWTPTTLTNAPTNRHYHSAVWTGSEMIVWGGFGNLNTGGRYNPSTDSWTATNTVNTPSGRSNHTAVWTGTEMIVWGGTANSLFLNTGGRYNPATDSWTATSTTNAPAERWKHTAVWTGSEMIVWAGDNFGGHLNTGGRYNPSTDSWTATSTTNAPSARLENSAVWTGSEMIVWGGSDSGGPTNTGGRYNPSTDNWAATSTAGAPTARHLHTAVWNDSGHEMIVWCGDSCTLGCYLNTGGRYNPTNDSWTATSTINAPDPRRLGTQQEDTGAVWTGSEMIDWGGTGTGGVNLNTGGRYNPITDSWTATSLINAPTARSLHTVVWTGSEMIIWGGGTGDDDPGGRYCAQSGPAITLSTRVHKRGGKNVVVLTWTPADGGSVNVLRDGVVAGMTDDDGAANDWLGTQTGTFTYQVCETDSGDCSNEVTVRVRGTDD